MQHCLISLACMHSVPLYFCVSAIYEYGVCAMDDSRWRPLLVPSVLYCVGQVRNNISRGCNSQHFPFHTNSYYFNLFLICAWLCFYFLSLFNVLFVARAFSRFLFARACIIVLYSADVGRILYCCEHNGLPVVNLYHFAFRFWLQFLSLV